MNLFALTPDGSGWRKEPHPADVTKSPKFRPKPVTWPTTARPGTKEKLRVMMVRVSRGEEVFSPHDERL
jgi:hypothetical protein